MSEATFDYTVVERSLEHWMREQGLSPHLIPGGVESGYDRLTLRREKVEIVEAQFPDRSTPSYMTTLEISADLRHPALGESLISDLITRRVDVPEHPLVECTRTYMEVTFPALRSLFDGACAPGASSIKLSSFTPALGRPIRWEVYTGTLQILGDAGGHLATRFNQRRPLLLLFDALTGHLAEPRLHWCKIYGSSHPRAGLTFGCSIDGEKSVLAEAEMYQKFRQDGIVPGQWEFRQFLILRPAGEADEELSALLKKKADEALPRLRDPGRHVPTPQASDRPPGSTR